MSIPVEIKDLAATMNTYGWAYLLTVRDSMRPHIVAVSPVWDGDALVMPVGRGTGANAEARSEITLCFPPLDPTGYSLIVDGDATLEIDGDDRRVRFAPSGAVLHRPAGPEFGGGPTGCGQDCLPVDAAAT